jgi:hypothetical protein
MTIEASSAAQSGGVVFIGIAGHVLALDGVSGDEIWRTKLAGSSHFVTVSYVNGRLVAAAAGEIWALDALDGAIVWHNRLKGLGVGFVTIAGVDDAHIASMAAQTAAAAAAAEITSNAAIIG